MLRPLRATALLGLLLVACGGDETDEAAGEDSAPLSAAGDQRDPATAQGERVVAEANIFGRRIGLRLSDADNAGWATIDDGAPGDEVWLDRSFDGGLSWGGGSKLGATKIPRDGRGWRTLMFAVDAPADKLVGALRACGKAGDRREVSCTPWFRTTVNAATPVDAAATAMMQLYDLGKGTWRETGWWNSANALTAMLDYSRLTGSTSYRYVMANTFDKNSRGNFTNDYLDDTGWWGLAWVRAFDLTGEQRYLDMARRDAEHMWRYKDDRCGGGVWWKTDKRYKNAITNELFIKLAASLHNRMGGDTTWLSRADEVWRWFDRSGMINGESLVNDGLDDACRNNGQTTWTYNQGVILGGLVELSQAKNDLTLLERARVLAKASSTNGGLNPNGILREPCESNADSCDRDGPSFKGIYMRNLGELERVLADRPFGSYIAQQAAAIVRGRNSLDQYGVHWGSQPDRIDGARQHSALDALNATK